MRLLVHFSSLIFLFSNAFFYSLKLFSFLESYLAHKASNTTIAEFANTFIMSHLIWSYSVCPLVFIFQHYTVYIESFFQKFANIILSPAFFGALRVRIISYTNTKDVNECSNIRIPFEYSNTISEFEYLNFLSVLALCFFKVFK